MGKFLGIAKDDLALGIALVGLGIGGYLLFKTEDLRGWLWRVGKQVQ